MIGATTSRMTQPSSAISLRAPLNRKAALPWRGSVRRSLTVFGLSRRQRTPTKLALHQNYHSNVQENIMVDFARFTLKADHQHVWVDPLKVASVIQISPSGGGGSSIYFTTSDPRIEVDQSATEVISILQKIRKLREGRLSPSTPRFTRWR